MKKEDFIDLANYLVECGHRPASVAWEVYQVAIGGKGLAIHDNTAAWTALWKSQPNTRDIKIVKVSNEKITKLFFSYDKPISRIDAWTAQFKLGYDPEKFGFDQFDPTLTKTTWSCSMNKSEEPIDEREPEVDYEG